MGSTVFHEVILNNLENENLNKNADKKNRNKPSVSNSFTEADHAQPSTGAGEQKFGWLSGGGEISDIIRAKDWSKTPLGPIESWPQSLRISVSLCLSSNFPMNIIWGPEAVQIYNLAFKELCGGAHPQALGESYRVTWASAWPEVGKPFEKALLGEASFIENQHTFLLRNGYIEESFFTFSLSPIRNEHGQVVGIFHPVTETTIAMLNQRRTRLLRDIAIESTNSDTVSEAVQRIGQTLSDYKSDIPGAIIFLETEPKIYEAVATSGNVKGFTDPILWPIDKVFLTAQPCYIDDVVETFGAHPCSEYNEIVERACLLPLKVAGYKEPIGFLAVTISPRLPFNEAYMAFFDMLSNAVGAAISNALVNESIIVERTVFQTDIQDLKVERNSQDVVEKALLESKEMAEAATRSKSAFLANMSHEIRTPLAAILGFSEILKSHDISVNDRDKYLGIITRSGHSLVRIIDDILDLSKIEAGKIQIDQEPVQLAELIRDVIAMFSDRALGKGLSLSFDPKGLPDFKIQSDAVKIRQILVNLLGNAIKFTSEGSVKVHGTYKALEDSEFEITLSITDTGIGITSEQGKNLFKAFTQADNKTTRHFGGTGLGLALSKKLANAMGGNVYIQKNPEVRGSTFQLKLIAHKSMQASADAVAAPVASGKAVEKHLAGWSILVVDDSEDNRLLMRILLEREGASVDDATSGEEGVRKALSSNYDVVLMDIQMPEMDGYQALINLRNQKYRKPVFALTAHTMKEEKDKALAAGFSGHIAKPVNPAAVVETLLAHARRLH